MNIGIIGCGNIADTHVESILEAQPDSSISVCDPVPGKADLLKRKYNLKNAYTDIKQMLKNEKPVSVHILSPPQLHYDHVKECLLADCNVLVEKPFVLNYDEVDDLYNLAAKKNKILCVDHSMLYQPSVLKMMNDIKSNKEIRILHINSFYGIESSPLSEPQLFGQHWKEKLKGGAIIDTLIHPISLIVELIGKPELIATNFLESNGVIDEISISIKTKESIVVITVSNRSQPFRRTTEVITDHKTFVIDHSTEVLVSLDSGFGPRSLKKLIKNFAYSSQLALGTIGTVLKVLRKKLKENPGTRQLINNYYNHLSGNGSLPVSIENVKNATYTLDKISTDLETLKKESNIVQSDKVSTSEKSVLKDKKIYVTGASGFLGKHVCADLAHLGYNVFAQVRRGPNADKIAHPLIERQYIDFRYEDTNYNSILKDINTVVHCAHAAGANTWEEFKRINVDSTLSLYEAAAKRGCENFIFLSSVAVYGIHQKRKTIVNEESPTTLGKSKYDFYIRSKTIAENLLIEKAKDDGPKLLIIRPGVLYSANGLRLARRSIPTKNGLLLISFGRGKNHMPFTRVDILSRAICKIVDSESIPEGIYNMTGKPTETLNDFITDRMNQFGINCSFFRLPVVPFRILAFFLENSYKISFRKSPPPITKYLLDSGTRNIYYDCDKAAKEFGWDEEKAVKPLNMSE